MGINMEKIHNPKDKICCVCYPKINRDVIVEERRVLQLFPLFTDDQPILKVKPMYLCKKCFIKYINNILTDREDPDLSPNSKLMVAVFLKIGTYPYADRIHSYFTYLEKKRLLND